MTDSTNTVSVEKSQPAESLAVDPQRPPSQSPEGSPEIITQRIYRPMSETSEDQPVSYSDNDRTLYVYELEQTVNEADLFKVFSTYGHVLSIRVVKDPVSKLSLGYAYVNFKEQESAQSALSHDFKYIKSKPCRVMPFQKDPSLRRSTPKTHVFIKNLDPATTTENLIAAFSPFGSIVSCRVTDNKFSANHRGFGYVNYEQAEAADEAIAKMNGATLNGRAIVVGHHISKRDRLSKLDELKATFTNLYIKNIDLHTSDQEFESLFAAHGELLSFSLPLDDEGLSRGFGFVNYKTHEEAVAAVEALNDFEFRGKKLYVSRAQKKYEREEELRQQYETARLRRVAKYASTNLYIKYLDQSIDDEALHEAFSPFGVITSARVMTDDNGNSRGFGFVCYSNSEEAQRAIGEMHNRELRGMNLFVTIAQRRENRKPVLMPLHPFFGNGMGAMPGPQHVPMGEPSQPGQQRQVGNARSSQMRMPMAAPGQFVNPYYYQMPSTLLPMNPNGWNRRPMVGPNGEPLVFPGTPTFGYPVMGIPGGFRGPVIGKQENGFNGTSSGRSSPSNSGSKHGSPRQGQRARGNNGGSGGGKGNAQLAYGSTLAAVVASAASPEAARQAIGEALYPKIQRHAAVKGEAEMAAKLTGMMLDLDTAELLKWVDDEAILNAHIQQAYDQYMEFLAQREHE